MTYYVSSGTLNLTKPKPNNTTGFCGNDYSVYYIWSSLSEVILNNFYDDVQDCNNGVWNEMSSPSWS